MALTKIYVKATDPTRVALWERHDEHPGGEAYVGGAEAPVHVALTPAVIERLESKVLYETTKAGNEKKVLTPLRSDPGTGDGDGDSDPGTGDGDDSK